MALSKLSGDEQCIIFSKLCNKLDPGIAVAFSSASNELRALTQAQLQQLRADHEAAGALCRKLGLRSCKELREAKTLSRMYPGGLNAADLALLGTLGSMLPALEELCLGSCSIPGSDGVQRLAAGLGAGSLRAMTVVELFGNVGDAGASALAAAMGRGALPRLKRLSLSSTAIGDAGLVALAPALRRQPALKDLYLPLNPIKDEGLAALVAPPPPAGASSPPTDVLTKLKRLSLRSTQITDAGCAALAAALDSGVMPALKNLYLNGVPASAAVKSTVWRGGLEVNV